MWNTIDVLKNELLSKKNVNILIKTFENLEKEKKFKDEYLLKLLKIQAHLNNEYFMEKSFKFGFRYQYPKIVHFVVDYIDIEVLKKYDYTMFYPADMYFISFFQKLKIGPTNLEYDWSYFQSSNFVFLYFFSKYENMKNLSKYLKVSIWNWDFFELRRDTKRYINLCKELEDLRKIDNLKLILDHFSRGGQMRLIEKYSKITNLNEIYLYKEKAKKMKEERIKMLKEE